NALRPARSVATSHEGARAAGHLLQDECRKHRPADRLRDIHQRDATTDHSSPCLIMPLTPCLGKLKIGVDRSIYPQIKGLFPSVDFHLLKNRQGAPCHHRVRSRTGVDACATASGSAKSGDESSCQRGTRERVDG